MKPIPLTAEMLAVATGVIWFESPEEALADPVRFMAFAMTHALPLEASAVQEPNSTASPTCTALDRNVDVRRQAVRDWVHMREQGTSAPNAEEVRRRAVEDWNEQFGPKKKI